MKSKKILSVLCTGAVLAAALAGCTAQAADDGAQAAKSNDGITFTAEYNAEEKKVDTVLVNNENSGVALKYVDNLYSLYQLKDGEWENITPSHAGYDTGLPLMPENGYNTVERSYAVYPTAQQDGEEDFNINRNFEEGGLASGTYKITKEVEAYNYEECPTFSAEMQEKFTTKISDYGKYINSKLDSETVVVEAEFTVE